MHLQDRRVVLTGASSGIGRAAAVALARAGARVGLSGRNEDALHLLAQQIRASGGRADVIVADLLDPRGPARLVQGAAANDAALDVLVNCAGVSSFSAFEETSAEQLQHLFACNVVAPMRLTQEVLPRMRAQGRGLIVNVGSIFGSIGFPCFAGYSATKFALRGFSEALRRELKGSGIDVLYFAPRYTRTPINGAAVQSMAAALKMHEDEPSEVADALVDAITRGVRERLLGAPERFFVRLNQLLPRLVDRSLGAQAAQMRPFALRAPTPSPATPAGTLS